MRMLLASSSWWVVMGGFFAVTARLAVWALLFGTYKHPDANPVERTGLAGNPVSAGFPGQLAHPFGELRRLWRRDRRPAPVPVPEAVPGDE